MSYCQLRVVLTCCAEKAQTPRNGGTDRKMSESEFSLYDFLLVVCISLNCFSLVPIMWIMKCPEWTTARLLKPLDSICVAFLQSNMTLSQLWVPVGINRCHPCQWDRVQGEQGRLRGQHGVLRLGRSSHTSVQAGG